MNRSIREKCGNGGFSGGVELEETAEQVSELARISVLAARQDDEGFGCLRAVGKARMTERLESMGGGGVAAVLLLAGGVTPSPLKRVTGRGALELPVSGGRVLMDLWRQEVGDWPLRLLVDEKSTPPRVGEGIVIARDGGELRGAGGALRDATRDLREDEWVVAAAASQVMVRPLKEVVEVLRVRASGGADAVLMVNQDGTPGMVLLARVGLLREIPAVGFVDLKEQALPMLAKKGNVRAVRERGGVAICVRTPGDYVRALRRLHGGNEELWRSAFDLVEQGATVAGDAVVHDSVVLAGATVGKGAVLVRSLVGAGAVVGAGEVCVDRAVVAQDEDGKVQKGVAA